MSVDSKWLDELGAHQRREWKVCLVSLACLCLMLMLLLNAERERTRVLHCFVSEALS